MRSNLNRMLLVAPCALALAAPVLAQADAERPQQRRQQPRMQRLDEAQTAAAWKAEVATVARSLGLDAAATEKLGAAYAQSRTHLAAMAEERRAARPQPGDPGAAGAGNRRGGRGEGGGGAGAGGDPGAGRGAGGAGFGGAALEAIEAERTTLKTALAAFLDEKSTDVAMKSLGLFDARWDRMAHEIIGFKLADDAAAKAQDSVRNFIVATAALRQSEDREAARMASEMARDELSAALEPLLSEEQMQTIMAIGNPMGRGGFGGPGAGPGAGGAGGAALLERLDANGDGKLQKDELPERMQAMFDELDANKDGALDADELAAMRNRRGGGRGGRGGPDADQP